MRVGVNCINVDPGYVGGVNTYTFGLIDGFLALKKKIDLTLFVSPKNAALFNKYSQLERVKIISCLEMDSFARKALLHASLYVGSSDFYRRCSQLLYPGISKLIQENCDLMYVPTSVLFPFDVGVPSVVSMHDIQHEHFPENFSFKQRLWRRIYFDLTARHANYVQASSHFIKEDLLSHFSSLKPSQIEVIREGVSDQDFAMPENEVKERVANLNVVGDYLFYPAQLWPHKDHLTVLRALKLVRDQKGLEIPLILCGARFGSSERIFDFIQENKLNSIRPLGKLPFRDLVALYRGANILVTAALYESSSLCILEGAVCGTPVIASATPPNIEVSHFFNINFFEPGNPEDLAEKLAIVWNSDELLRRQSEHNQKAVQQMNWVHIAGQYQEWFTKISS